MTASHVNLSPDPHAPGLRFDRLDAGYGETCVLRDVTLEVGRGELVGFVGPNGAGKSTLLRTVTGSAHVSRGVLEIAGIAHGELDAASRARIVGVVPQMLPSLFAFTAREFVAMGRHAHVGRWGRLSTGDGDDRRIVEGAMDRTDTLRLADERVDTLSGGDVQRLTLAQALAQQPEVLLLDEATSHLDLNHRLQVLDLVRELADDGMAVAGVFHDLDLAARYSDRLAIVSDNAVPVCGDPCDVLTPERIREVFAVRAVVGTDAVTGTVSVTPVLREESRAETRDATVFVLAGSGSGAALMRRLVKDGFCVTAAGLSVGDVDYAVAETLGVEFVHLPPFGRMEAPDSEAVESLASVADVRVVCDVPFGSANLPNLEAVAKAEGDTVLVGRLRSERDFTAGQATRLWEKIAARGGTVVDDSDEARAEIERLIG